MTVTTHRGALSPAPALPPARPWHCGKRFLVLITKKCLELRGGMEGPGCHCSAHQGSQGVDGAEQGWEEAGGHVPPHPWGHGCAQSTVTCTPGTPGMPSPCRHKGWQGCLCWSPVPLAGGGFCPQRCQETVPSSPPLSASLYFPF